MNWLIDRVTLYKALPPHFCKKLAAIGTPFPIPTRWKGRLRRKLPFSSAYWSSSWMRSAIQSLFMIGSVEVRDKRWDIEARDRDKIWRWESYLWHRFSSPQGESRPCSVGLTWVVEGEHLRTIVSLHQWLKENRSSWTRVKEIMNDHKIISD